MVEANRIFVSSNRSTPVPQYLLRQRSSIFDSAGCHTPLLELLQRRAALSPPYEHAAILKA